MTSALSLCLLAVLWLWHPAAASAQTPTKGAKASKISKEQPADVEQLQRKLERIEAELEELKKSIPPREAQKSGAVSEGETPTPPVPVFRRRNWSSSRTSSEASSTFCTNVSGS